MWVSLDTDRIASDCQPLLSSCMHLTLINLTLSTSRPCTTNPTLAQLKPFMHMQPLTFTHLMLTQLTCMLSHSHASKSSLSPSALSLAHRRALVCSLACGLISSPHATHLMLMLSCSCSHAHMLSCSQAHMLSHTCLHAHCCHTRTLLACCFLLHASAAAVSYFHSLRLSVGMRPY